ncbi:MAG TPA: type II toxin-antitoxin system PemK/MazF family toxin [Polyangiaceae bacterium]|nr:type II toxin-antitoxin system PemK/MazF family toxin [Polyangiaceae bacterium]
MKGGDLVIVATPGDYGKPRPALVVQSDLFNGTQRGSVRLPVDF